MSSTYAPSDFLTQVKGVGPATQAKLDRLDIITISDLLKHFPTRYLDFTRQVKIKDLQKDQTASFLATLTGLKSFYSKNKKLITTATAQDETGKISLTWFNNPYIKKIIVEGEQYSLAGKPSFFGPHLTLISPVFEPGNSFSLNTQGLVPVYPQTAGLTSKWLRQKINELLNQLTLLDPLDQTLLSRNNLVNLTTAVSGIHFPQNKTERFKADRRLAFNEHLRIGITNRLELLRLGPSIGLKIDPAVDDLTTHKLPWKLTPDQQAAVDKIYADLRKTEFSHRLIQGETGSGKTATLIYAANQCLAAGYSCAILAPTEVLANQHFETFSQYCLFPHQVSLITASTVIPAHGNSLSEKPTLFIGTHALFSHLNENLQPPLAFVAVDEQHKFGVVQRDLLLKRSPVPHLFNLSATPIPRTVALGLLGEIKTSTIKNKPRNRLPTKTFVISPKKFKDSPAWLIKELTAGNQIFVVCPHINSSTGAISTVTNIAQSYRKLIPPEFPLWTLHGRLKPAEQKTIIDHFKATRGSLLVATSLIEVGIDIPEANIMIIHSAERFGLAQLHQLRGRVGRGEGQGYCFLVPSLEDDVEIDRLKLMSRYHSGMTLAKKDLRLRGAGEIFGSKQHGTLPTELRYFWSRKLFLQAKAEARRLVDLAPAKAALIARRLITW